jgi:hypothetical protein
MFGLPNVVVVYSWSSENKYKILRRKVIDRRSCCVTAGGQHPIIKSSTIFSHFSYIPEADYKFYNNIITWKQVLVCINLKKTHNTQLRYQQQYVHQYDDNCKGEVHFTTSIYLPLYIFF